MYKFQVFLLAGLALACTPKSPVAEVAPVVDPLLAEYRVWVLRQGDEFLSRTEAFVQAWLKADKVEAQRLYASARQPFERIEPIAEALGDFDPRLDAREGDVLDADWRGFHRLEKLLWSDRSLSEGHETARTLLQDARLLRVRLETAELSLSGLLTGAVELLNEISSSKVTGEEERYSHTDLWDFEANLQGAFKIFQLVETLVMARDPGVAQLVASRFSALFDQLALYRSKGGFVSYTELKPNQVKSLAQAVDALAEPLSQLSKVLGRS